MSRALLLLDAVPESALTHAHPQAAARLRARFGGEFDDVPGDLPPRAARILRAYRGYWRKVMLRKATPSEGEAGLAHALRTALVSDGDLDALSDAARAAIEEDGLHALTGVTL